MIELVEKKDCVSNGDRNGKGGGKGGGRRRTMLRRIDNRDRKKCHKCGRDGGLWREILNKGRREYRFLCNDCLENVERDKLQ